MMDGLLLLLRSAPPLSTSCTIIFVHVSSSQVAIAFPLVLLDCHCHSPNSLIVDPLLHLRSYHYVALGKQISLQ